MCEHGIRKRVLRVRTWDNRKTLTSHRIASISGFENMENCFTTVTTEGWFSD